MSGGFTQINMSRFFDLRDGFFFDRKWWNQQHQRNQASENCSSN